MMATPSIHMSLCFVVLLLFVTPIVSRDIENQNNELNRLSRIKAQLEKKPPVKTINSPDGDIIDCVLFEDQPAFDLPGVKYQETTLELPEWPTGYNNSGNTTSGEESSQIWSASGEECPEGSVPILRTTEQILLGASNNMTSFEEKYAPQGHEYSISSVTRGPYYGARAYLNVWAPKANENNEFSLAQIWVVSGSYQNKDLNTIEAGWQVYPSKYRDNNPRLFGYWTRDAYTSTGCYNHQCPGFVQVNRRITFGAAIKPISSYNGQQFDINLMIWKDPKTKNWWLSFNSGTLVGYWPSSLFTRLKDSAEIMQFGGEIVNRAVSGHTTTQMGSGHFSEEGFKKSAYFKNVQFVNQGNGLFSIPQLDLKLGVDHPNCYDIKTFSDDKFGTHFYFGGPGKNPRCP